MPSINAVTLQVSTNLHSEILRRLNNKFLQNNAPPYLLIDFINSLFSRINFLLDTFKRTPETFSLLLIPLENKVFNIDTESELITIMPFIP